MALRASSWLESSPSSGGPYPPINVFRNGDDFLTGLIVGVGHAPIWRWFPFRRYECGSFH